MIYSDIYNLLHNLPKGKATSIFSYTQPEVCSGIKEVNNKEDVTISYFILKNKAKVFFIRGNNPTIIKITDKW